MNKQLEKLHNSSELLSIFYLDEISINCSIYDINPGNVYTLNNDDENKSIPYKIEFTHKSIRLKPANFDKIESIEAAIINTLLTMKKEQIKPINQNTFLLDIKNRIKDDVIAIICTKLNTDFVKSTIDKYNHIKVITQTEASELYAKASGFDLLKPNQLIYIGGYFGYSAIVRSYFDKHDKDYIKDFNCFF